MSQCLNSREYKAVPMKENITKEAGKRRFLLKLIFLYKKWYATVKKVKAAIKKYEIRYQGDLPENAGMEKVYKKRKTIKQIKTAFLHFALFLSLSMSALICNPFLCPADQEYNKIDNWHYYDYPHNTICRKIWEKVCTFCQKMWSPKYNVRK